MRIPYTAFLLALLFPLAPEAQTGTCAPGHATASLNTGAADAPLYNTGTLFYGDGGRSQYEIPKGSGLQAFYANGLWIGGYVDSEFRFSGADRSPAEFWPGPLDADGNAPADCAAYDRIYSVTLADIAAYNAGGTPIPDLAEWPADLGAPVLDGDGDPDNYDLAAGDRPALLGDQTAWWVMNDRGNTHGWSDSPPVGIEVRTTAYAASQFFADTYTSLPEGSTLPNTTFYRIEITNRNADAITDAMVGSFSFARLGDDLDNYVGCDLKREMGYVYNRDDDDDPAAGGYGANPPALGTLWLGGPSRDAMYACATYNSNSGVTGTPQNGEEAYGYLQGRWRDGSSFTYGGSGYQTGFPVQSLFTAPPPSYWSMHDVDGMGTEDGGTYYPVALVSHGPVTLEPGETITLDLALVWSRGEDGALSSVAALRDDVLSLRTQYAYDQTDGNTPPFSPLPGLSLIQPGDLPTAGEAAPIRGTLRTTVSPNPASGDALVQIDLPEASTVRLTVFDALGRAVAVPQDGPLAGAEHRLRIQTEGWAPGVYVYRLTVSPEAGGAPIEASGRFVVVR